MTLDWLRGVCNLEKFVRSNSERKHTNILSHELLVRDLYDSARFYNSKVNS